MATVKRFEELQVWQLAEAQCKAYYALVQSGSFPNYDPLRDQMDRSSASVMDNIAEGFDQYSRNDFKHFLTMARGSNAEYRSQLYRAHARSILTHEHYRQLNSENEHLGVKLHNFISYLSKTEYKTKPTNNTSKARPGEGTEIVSEDRSPLYSQTDYSDYPDAFTFSESS